MIAQRTAQVFVVRAGKVLLARRAGDAVPYPARWTTFGGDVAPGEPPDAAARRALAAELGVGDAAVRFVRAGLPLEFSDTIRRRTTMFRIYPFLYDASADLATPAGTRWIAPDELIVETATGQTIPELDEAFARVWDPVGALPPLFRDQARAIAGAGEEALDDPTLLVARAIELVRLGAPPERVAALRPALARLVNAARAAVRPQVDVARELDRACGAAAGALAAALEGKARVAIAGAPPRPLPDGVEVAVVPGAQGVEGVDAVVLFPVAVTTAEDVVVRAGGLALARSAADAPRAIPVIAAVDPWLVWRDDAPPPLEPGLEIVRSALITRLVGV